MTTSEVWLPVVGYERAYEVSNQGRVRRSTPARGSRAGHILTGTINKHGYVIVALRDESGKSDRLLSRLVCEAFHGPAPEGKPYALHSNGKSLDNCADNLRWGSQADNISDAIAHGTMIRGERQGGAKLRESDIAIIRRMRARGHTQQYVADQLGVTRGCISRIEIGKTWKHLQEKTA